jgi:anti-sigma factor RsiW
MNCGQARNLFGAYWDDELTQAEREWLEAHFVSCAVCRREYEELTRTLELVADLPRVEVAQDFADRVLTRARRRSPATDRIPAAARRWVPITASAVLLAVLGGMVMQWTGMPLAPRRPATVALEQPVLVHPDVAPTTGRDARSTPIATPGTGLVAEAASVPDSLFDHSEDVEFILDSVTLRKGRAHTVVRVPTGPTRGEQAVITF